MTPEVILTAGLFCDIHMLDDASGKCHVGGTKTVYA